jgi:hypothetical protein
MNLSYSILLILVTLFVFGSFANGESSPDSQLLYERINSENFYNKVKASQAQTSYTQISHENRHIDTLSIGQISREILGIDKFLCTKCSSIPLANGLWYQLIYLTL